MLLSATYKKHTLDFKFEAGTSRGVLTKKDTWFLLLKDTQNPSIIGIGECAPLVGLSPDDLPSFENKLNEVCNQINQVKELDILTSELIEKFSLNLFPSLAFGLETALLDLKNGGTRIIVDGPFFRGNRTIPINGLVWMGDEFFMQDQLEQKLQQGYACIKLKIGAIDFNAELRLLEKIRKNFGPEKITLRLDANGAFGLEDAKLKLEILSQFSIHSIEQPIKAGQQFEMANLCRHSPIPIALDEELIGIKSFQQKRQLLESIKPQFIILKPTLVGGLFMCKEWIELADTLQIGYWMTSALESNIGLNAISQFTDAISPSLPQGLGTGQLYHNNINSPLTIENGNLYYDSEKVWDLTIF